MPLFVKTENSPKPQSSCCQRCSNKHKHQALPLSDTAGIFSLPPFYIPDAAPSDSGLTVVGKKQGAIRMELAQRSKTFFSQQLAAPVESGVRKQLKAKDEEMERKLNSVLEDKVRSAFAENQIRREFVGTNEVTTNLLSTNLEQILRMQ